MNKKYLHREILLLTICALGCCAAESTPQGFSVVDDIQMARFTDPSENTYQQVKFSDNHEYFAVVTERGLVDRNLVEDSLWVFSTDLVEHNLRPPTTVSLTASSPLVQMTASDGPVITGLTWFGNSNLAFRAQTSAGVYRLFTVDAKTGAVSPLSAENQNVGEFGLFDVRNRDAVYTVLDGSIENKLEDENRRRPSEIATGRSLRSLILTNRRYLDREWYFDWREIWAVIGGRRFRVDTSSFQSPLHISPAVSSLARGGIALSPDGHSAVTIAPVAFVPQKWEEYPTYRHQVYVSKFKAGPQNPSNVSDSWFMVYQFVIIDLASGRVRPLLDAPIGTSGGYRHPRPIAAWSADGHHVALTNTYVPFGVGSGPSHQSIRAESPCIAVVDVENGKAVCVEPIALGGHEEREQFVEIDDIRFSSHDAKHLQFDYTSYDGSNFGTAMYRQTKDGSWKTDRSSEPSTDGHAPFDVLVQQSLNDPPRLVAIDRSTGAPSAIVLDPNSKIRQTNLGDVCTYRWKDETGRDWIGGLAKPLNYVHGRRYPLVIQTHGFFRDHFMSSGAATSAFAARPLAAMGIMVLQVDDEPCHIYFSTPEEIVCAKRGYESAVKKLVEDGLVDQTKLGIIGFSRTCIYTLSELTSTRFHFSAATINDGSPGGYLQFMIDVDFDPETGNGVTRDNGVLRDLGGLFGAAPIGAGLMKWYASAPVLNMDKLETPLRVEAVGRDMGLLEMWEPYAWLRYLGRPTELVLIDYGTHPLSNPAERIASQGGNVDWFRFWLTGEEDPDPAKAGQYARWHELRKLQEKNQADKVLPSSAL